MKYFQGEVMSEGVAIGFVHSLAYFSMEKNSNAKIDEKENLNQAISLSIQQIKELLDREEQDKDYLSMQLMVLQDELLKEEILNFLDQGNSLNHSVSLAIEEFKKPLLNSTNSYLQERSFDFSDIEMRITRNLNGDFYETINSPFILYAKELYPSYLIQNKKNILGIITKKGGYTSHGAILCRQLNIPYIIADVEVVEGEEGIIDTRKQQIILSPTIEQVHHYKEAMLHLSKETFYAVPHPTYHFLANVSTNVEINKVLEYGFDGVGLYRTEMIFMNSNRPLSFDEQYEIYYEAMQKLQGKSVCFRTFDIGDDKQLPYVRTYNKGIENYLYNKDLFETQIKALLKANQFNTLQIMFPMITSHAEFIYLKNWVKNIQKEIKDSSKFQLGIMLETKEALEHILDFTDAEFISIGTNDLILSIYHICRDLQTLEMQQYLNDLIHKLKQVVKFCDTHNIHLSICGELASIEPALREFMKIGIKNFSVAAPAIKVLNHIYKEFH